MKGQVIGKNMTHGYAGDYARQPDMIVDTHPLGGSTAVKFGTPLVYDNNSNVVSFGASRTAVDFVGMQDLRNWTERCMYVLPRTSRFQQVLWEDLRRQRMQEKP